MKRMLVIPAILVLLFIQNISAQVLSPFLPVCSDSGQQGWIQAAYNSNDDEYLVVWEDYRNLPSDNSDTTWVQGNADIYGQRVRGDGTLLGGSFPICDLKGSYQYWPHLDFDPVNGRYLVIFEDYRNGDGDIYGCLIDAEGNKVWTDSSEADTCFAIASDSSGIYAPSVAFNYREGTYLVVWADARGALPGMWVHDVYGQIVDADGRLLPPTEAANPKANFPIADINDFDENVPDVSYHPAINEWLVVFGRGDDDSEIYCQRIGPGGNLLKQDGTEGVDWIQVSEGTGFWPDSDQPRVQFNWETSARQILKSLLSDEQAECLIVWNTQAVSAQRDIYGQRLIFIPDSQAVRLGFHAEPAVDGRYFAAFSDTNGVLSAGTRSNFPVSDAAGIQRTCDLAYSTLDDEWFVAWGDMRRDVQLTWNVSDLYGQRISVQEDGSVQLLNADRSGEVASSENIPVAVSDAYEGSWNILGVAHSSTRNEFFAAYTYNPNTEDFDTNDYTGNDIQARGSRGPSLPPAESRASPSIPVLSP